MDDSSMYEEVEDDGPSDATLRFAEDIDRRFKKEFPLKAETAQKRAQAAFRRHAPVMARKLNFDITLSPLPVVRAELATAKTAQGSAERQLSSLRQENEQLLDDLRRKDEQLSKKQIELESVREKWHDLREENAILEAKCGSRVADSNRVIEIWKTFGKKYYTWYNMASAQLESVRVYVENDGKFDDAMDVSKLNEPPRQMLRAMEQNEFDENTVELLGSGSVQEYEGVEFKVRRRDFEVARSDSSMANFTMPQSNQTMLDDSNATLFEQTMMTDGCPANRSIIEYEKNEKIQRLLLENSVLKDRLNVSMGRAEKSMLIEERNRTLEVEKNALQERLESTFTEIEAIRIGQANNLFKVHETDNSTKQLQLLDRITQLIAKNNQLEKDFEAATSRMTKLMRESADCEKRNERLEDAFSSENERRELLEKEKEELAVQLEALSAKIKELESRAEAEETITTAPAAEPEPTDAGNSTQIFHMATNPLAAAHAEFQAAQTRKRKLTDAPDNDITAKHHREDEIAELEDRLDICEREKKVLEDSYNLHKELASKFRQACVALTGLQIKLKDADEGICSVQSEYEAGSEQFVFKYFFGTPRIDMLDVNCESSNEMIRKWEPLMKKYIGERNSIPAFLAAVTLQMEQEREFDETMHERTHTFSVLHED
uniref:Spindle assembly checkpoint component MAD1 n=1 Tax=Caenorhabditis japonica TaxID=281687 RepID=A0A8R1E2I4_CAEJA